MGEIERALVEQFRSVERKDITLALGLSELLLTYALAESESAEFGGRLEEWARLLSDEGKHDHARRYFDAAISWFDRAKETRKVWQLTADIAKEFFDEAKRHTSQLAAVGFYERALQTYRQIPKAERAALGVEKRIEVLREEISRAGKNAIGEMKPVSVGTDIADLVEKARTFVKGKPPMEALYAFANIYSGVKAAQIREQCIRKVTEFPLSSMFGATHFSADGRVVAKRSAITSGEPDSDAALWSEMVSMYQMQLPFFVQGIILPALNTLALEHRFREQDFIWFTRQSPVIPLGRELLFGKGLFLGYDLDFAAALHLLVPQIEHMVRSQLKAAGATTTSIDQEGIENETGLSALVKLPQMTQCFGEDLAFELHALFCDPVGPNLRNQVAHGLLDFDACQSVPSIYAWWLSFRLMFNTFWSIANLKHDVSSASAPPA